MEGTVYMVDMTGPTRVCTTSREVKDPLEFILNEVRLPFEFPTPSFRHRITLCSWFNISQDGLMPHPLFSAITDNS